MIHRGLQLLHFDEKQGNDNVHDQVIYNLKITFKFFTEVLFLSIILCLANTGIVNVLVSTLYSKPDEVTGYECGLYSTKGGRLKDRISFYTVGLTMMIFDVEVVLTFAFLLSLTFATTSSFLSVGIFVVILGLDLFQELYLNTNHGHDQGLVSIIALDLLPMEPTR